MSNLPPNIPPVPPVQTAHDSLTEPQTENPNYYRWGFGCFFVLGGLVSGNPLMALIWLAMGAVLIPPAAEKIEELTGWTLDQELLIKIIAGGLIATVILAGLSAGASMSGSGASDADYDKWIDRVGAIGSPMP